MAEYKTVQELSDDCLMYLKFSMFYDPEFEDVTDEEVHINYYWQIPNEWVYAHYDGIQFVQDDFGTEVEW